MNTDMSQQTKPELLTKLRRAYARAGSLYKRQLLDQAVSLLGYHRKAAIRALRARPAAPRPPGLLLGRPKTYHPDTLLPILKPIWFAAMQLCGLRLRALLPEWLPAYEAGHRRWDADLRQRSSCRASNGAASAPCASMGLRRRPMRGCWRRPKSARKPRPACKRCTPGSTPSSWLGTSSGRRRPSKPGDVRRLEGVGDWG
jgi:hypothetical protein